MMERKIHPMELIVQIKLLMSCKKKGCYSIKGNDLMFLLYQNPLRSSVYMAVIIFQIQFNSYPVFSMTRFVIRSCVLPKVKINYLRWNASNKKGQSKAKWWKWGGGKVAIIQLQTLGCLATHHKFISVPLCVVGVCVGMFSYILTIL